MATIFMESGSDATQDLSFYLSTSGSAASATDQAHTGPRSIKLSTGAGSANAEVRTNAAILADAGRRVSFWFRHDGIGATTTALFTGYKSDGSTQVFRLLTVTSSLVLQLVPVGATTVNGTIAIPADTWVRLTISYFITNTTTFAFKVYVNGVLDITATAGTLTATGTDRFRFFINGPDRGANKNNWFDDIYVDDGASSASQTDPGDIRVTAKRPFANGTANGFTGTGTPSGYGTGNAGYVNERPLSTTNFVSVVAASAVTEEYNIEGPTVGDVNIAGMAIKDVAGWCYAKALLSETASMVINGATFNMALTSSDTMFQSFSGATAYPAGTGADIGLITTTLATTVTLYECGILVAYLQSFPALDGIGDFPPFVPGLNAMIPSGMTVGRG